MEWQKPLMHHTSWVQDFCWAQSKTICIDRHMLKASPFKSAKGLKTWPQALVTIWALRRNGVILDRHCWNNESMFAAQKLHRWFSAFLELWLVLSRNARTWVEVCEISIVENAELEHYKNLKTVQNIYLIHLLPFACPTTAQSWQGTPKSSQGWTIQRVIDLERCDGNLLTRTRTIAYCRRARKMMTA